MKFFWGATLGTWKFITFSPKFKTWRIVGILRFKKWFDSGVWALQIEI
jgi:hypothetical protein